MDTKISLKRISKERKELENLKSKEIKLVGFDDNPYEFHFTVKGMDDSSFHGGYYHGVIKLPKDYPFKAPDIIFHTPNGKFEPNKAICLNYTSYHNETWTPNVKMVNLIETIRLFMLEKHTGIGIINSPDSVIKEHAAKSKDYNCHKCGPIKDIINKFLS